MEEKKINSTTTTSTTSKSKSTKSKSTKSKSASKRKSTVPDKSVKPATANPTANADASKQETAAPCTALSPSIALINARAANAKKEALESFEIRINRAHKDLQEAINAHNIGLAVGVSTIDALHDAVTQAKKKLNTLRVDYLFYTSLGAAEGFYRHLCDIGTVDETRVNTDKNGRLAVGATVPVRVNFVQAIEFMQDCEALPLLEKLKNSVARYVTRKLEDQTATIADIVRKADDLCCALSLPHARRKDANALVHLIGGQGKAISTAREITDARIASAFLDVMHARIHDINISIEKAKKEITEIEGVA